MKKFPIFIDLSERDVLFVGGGNIAERRAKVLCEFCKNVRMVAKEFTKDLEKMGEEGLLSLQKRAYETGDCEGAYMVLAATDDQGLNEQIVRDAKAAGALANACHDKSLCDFYFPGIVTKGDNMVVGVSASGEDHKKAANLRKKIAEILDGEH